MINRLQLCLSQSEYSALLAIALKELRTPAEQARYMLRQDFAKNKLLKLTDQEQAIHLQEPTSRKDESAC